MERKKDYKIKMHREVMMFYVMGGFFLLLHKNAYKLYTLAIKVRYNEVEK